VKRFKTVGLAIAMALTLTALLGVTSASASQFRAEEYPTSFNGAQGVQQKLTTGSGFVAKCSTATTSGTSSAASSALTLTPAFSGCKYGGLDATTSVNSCKYALHSTNEAAPYTGTIDIACSTEGDGIEFKVAGACTVKFLAQNSLGVSLANTGSSGSNRSITVTFNVSGLKYTETGGSCPTPGTHEDGTITGTSVLLGSNDAGAVGVYVANQQVEPPPFVFAGEEYPTTVNTAPQQTMHFTFPGGPFGGFNCTGFEGNGKLDVAGYLAMNILRWDGCYLGGGFTVNRNHCGLAFKATSSKSGSMSVTCPAGSEITFTALGCPVSIPPQTNRTAMEFENVGSGTTREVIAKFQVGNLKFTAGTGSGLGCSEPGPHEGGTIVGELRIQGYHYVGSAIGEGNYIKYLTTGGRQGIWVQ
jgi:hypothetical protein